MKTLKIVLMVALTIGITSVFAGAVSAADQANNQLIVKDQNADFGVVNQTTEQNESGNVSKIDLKGAVKPEEAVSVENSTISEPLAKTCTTYIIIQSTSYNCGPAALATALQNIGINTTEQEIAVLAGTDKNGTTMYGLVQAAKAKGLNAQGFRLSLNNLKKNNIVVLTINGTNHYSVILKITNESVKLADPSLGNIEMNLTDFEGVYSGYALIINNTNTSTQTNSSTDQINTPINLNRTITPLNSTDNSIKTIPTDAQSNNGTLTNEEMQSINGKFWQLALTLIGIGCAVVSLRDKYVPKKYWKYVSYHDPNKKVKSYIGKDHRIHYREY